MHKVQMHAGVISKLSYGFVSVRAITLLRPETPKQVLWPNSEDPDEMLHDVTGPFQAILGKGPWLELGKNMRHFGLFWDFFLEV